MIKLSQREWLPWSDVHVFCNRTSARVRTQPNPIYFALHIGANVSLWFS